ncbi:MAG: 30S ribosomal protein S4 [Anaerolineae bacterium]|nr:30S ribosomal protein S4 [Anaerolineae bacterium]
MARYTGPVCKLCRREGQKLYLKGERCYTSKCAFERRSYPAGQHGPNRRWRRKESDFALQLREKQRARRIYGVLERQFRRYFEEAERMPGLTGANLLALLESRLDNVVFRMGLADSRAQARQLVLHGHVTLNGRKTNIPSALVKPGDVVSITERARRLTYFRERMDHLMKHQPPEWLSLDPQRAAAKVLEVPRREQIDVRLNEQLIVEYYSR